jgi:type I restriction enzyme S subunit
MQHKEKIKSKSWRKIKLGEWLELKYGFGLPEEKRIKGNIPVYGSSGIVGFYNKPAVNTQGIIIGRKGNVGAVYFSINPFYPIDTVYFIDSLKKEGDLKFFYYLLKTIDFKKVDINVGVPGLNRDTAHSLEVLIPEDINEQKRIADILSAFDEKIEVNNKIIKILEEMAQEVFKEWFIKFNFPVEFEVKNEKLKVKSLGYKDAGRKFIDSELGKIPEGWEVKKLGDILSLEYGKALTAPNRKTGNIPVYASSGIVGYHNEKLDNGPGIIVGRAGIPGSVYWSQTDFYCVDSAFYVKTTISKYFVYYLLKYQNLESLISGSAVPGLNRNMVYLNLAVLPNIEIINKFEDFIKPVFLKIYNLKVENQKLATLRDLLLPRLINGEIKV